MRVEHYLRPGGKDVFERWLDSVRDQRALIAIERRIARIERDGFLGDHKYLSDGVAELRIDEGASSRILAGISGSAEILREMREKLTRSHESATMERFRNDPGLAANYLDAILDDGDEAELLQALQRISKAFGGVRGVADRAELNAKSLYRALSPNGNPEMKTLVGILKAMGMRLSVKPISR